MSGEDENNEAVDLHSGIMAFESKHFSQAMQLLSPIADQGDPEAQYRVAIMYQGGLAQALELGVERDHDGRCALLGSRSCAR